MFRKKRVVLKIKPSDARGVKTSRPIYARLSDSDKWRHMTVTVRVLRHLLVFGVMTSRRRILPGLFMARPFVWNMALSSKPWRRDMDL